MDNKQTAPKLWLEFWTKKIPLIFLSSLLFAGGVVLLFLNIPGWSLILGLPATQIGIVLLIFSFESIDRKKSTIPSSEYHYIDCPICGKQTLAPKFMNSRICDHCQAKVANKLKLILSTIFLVVSIPVCLIALQTSQEIRKQATEPIPTVYPTPTSTPTPLAGW